MCFPSSSLYPSYRNHGTATDFKCNRTIMQESVYRLQRIRQSTYFLDNEQNISGHAGLVLKKTTVIRGEQTPDTCVCFQIRGSSVLSTSHMYSSCSVQLPASKRSSGRLNADLKVKLNSDSLLTACF